MPFVTQVSDLDLNLRFLESPVIIANMIRAVRKKTCYSGTGVLFLQQDDNLSEDQNLVVI